MVSDIWNLSFFFWIGFSNPVALLFWDAVYTVFIINIFFRGAYLNRQSDKNVLARVYSSAADINFALARMEREESKLTGYLYVYSFLYLILKILQYIYFDSFSVFIEQYKLLLNYIVS